MSKPLREDESLLVAHSEPPPKRAKPTALEIAEAVIAGTYTPTDHDTNTMARWLLALYRAVDLRRPKEGSDEQA